jgi:hypothetical protein
MKADIKDDILYFKKEDLPNYKKGGSLVLYMFGFVASTRPT